jgi:arylsulfatase A-like enzyme/Tfp pilus assembly protein PilF
MKRILVRCCAIAIVFISASCRNHQAEETKKSSYNLILISIDTVRTDFLQLYNPKGAPTPNLNRLASKGFLFTDVISQVPFTLPSHCTMLTGTYPIKHLVQENTTSKLPESALTLTEVLKSNGYSTAGFVGALVLESGTGLSQGFDTYDDAFNYHDAKAEDMAGIQRNADTVAGCFLRWLSGKKPSKFFAFVHFYDPHTPYDPPPLFVPENHTPEDMYKGELRYVDSVIGKLFDELDKQGVWANTVLMITGDHGEMLGDHQEPGHGYFIYQEALKVPLLVLIPNQTAKSTVNSTVQIVDLMPTILQLLNIPVPQQVQGRSFAKVFSGQPLNQSFGMSESLTATKYFGAVPLSSIQDQSYKYIDSYRPELYDLKADSKELKNLYEAKKDLALKMKAKLDELVRRFAASSAEKDSERKLSPEEAERLAALGYISPGNTEFEKNSTRDAKDYIESWNDLNKVTALLKEEKFQESLTVLQRLRAAGAFSIDAQIFEARAYAGLNDYPKAIAMLKEVIKQDPENNMAQMILAYSYRSSGQPEEAIGIYKHLIEKKDSVLALQNYARQMIRLNRKSEVVAYLDRMNTEGKITDRYVSMVGEIYLNLNELDKARPFLNRALETNPDSYTTYVNLSASLAADGKIADALALLENHQNQFHQGDFLLQLGRLYNMAGDPQKEFQTFQIMVKIHPEDPRGYFFLGKILLEHQGNMQQVIQLAETGLSLNPGPEFQPFGYFLLGDAYTALGQKQKAQFYLDQAEKLRSQN